MGREIRMVPPNWAHPKDDRGNDQQMFDETYEDACAKWKAGYAEWERLNKSKSEGFEYWEWEGVPSGREMYRPWKSEDATWFQVWQTVGEGSPVTPPFATRQELADYLATHGDFWDQERRAGPWSREAAEKFCAEDGGWVPSLAMVAGSVVEGREVPTLK